MAEEQRKAELTAELAHARRRLGVNLGALRHDLDFPARAKSAVMKHPAAWISGATLLGMVLARLPARRKKAAAGHSGAASKIATVEKTGLLLGALKIAFDLSRPALAKWASRRVADYMESHRNDGRFS